jgi:DNA-binding NtrC family response regulator
VSLANDSTAKLSADASGYELLIAGHGTPWALPILEGASLVIGRGDDADVRLVAESVSRRHAVLRAGDAGFTIEDLGSSNGTLVRGSPVPPAAAVEVAVGESFLIGEFVLLVRPLRSRAAVRRIWSTEYFEARVAEQCERASEDESQAFCMVCVQLAVRPRSDAAERIAAEVAASDVLGQIAANVWAVLCIDRTPGEVSELTARLQRSLADVTTEARVSVLAYPRDGTSATALVACAAARESDAQAATDMLVRSPAMVALYAQIEPVARSNINVLILGETGVGKDVLARHVHQSSDRRDKPFVRVNCVALAESLLESELFGYEKGAFTGALQRKPGLLESAQGGTVFLDEIGELPQRLQPKLLQALETREVLSLGSVRPRSIDVRFVAATNRDLEAEALSGLFRSDLYYRLAGFTANIPPLRDRREDVLALAQSFLRTAAGARTPSPRIREDAAMCLLDYAWPGNVRELRNVIERALALSEGRSIGPEHLPLEKMRSVVLVRHPQSAAGVSLASEAPVADLTPDELAERQRILDALEACGGNQSMAAEHLGVSRSTLLNRLNTYRIRRPRRRRV